MRTAIGIVIALVASVAGTVLLWYGGGRAVMEFGRFGAEDAGWFPLLAGLGCLLLGAAAVTVRWSRAGVIAAGALQSVFSLLVILVPVQPAEGLSSPATRLLDALVALDPALGTGGYYFVAFGGGLLIGFALLGVGILARRGRLTSLARVLSALGGVLALAAASWAFSTGGALYRQTFQLLDGDAVVAITLVVAALLFGALIALSGRSAIGAWIAGGALSLVGALLLVIDPVAYAGMPPELLITLPVLGWSGTILAVGATLLGLALGITLRPAVPVVAAGAASGAQRAAPGSV